MPNFERAFVYVGEENGRPWGTKAEGFTEAPELNQTNLGIDLTGIIIVTGSGTEVLVVGTALTAGEQVGSQLRIGTPLAPLAGFGTIKANSTTTITVVWSTAAAPATVVGYTVKRKATTPDDDFDLYPQVRVLVPFQPEGPDTATPDIAYPPTVELAAQIGPGFILPASVTDWEDWGLFLDFSFLEGISSFGISEATDSRTSPATHSISAVGATSITHSNAIPAGLLDGGYLRLVDVTESGQPVSWARITTNDGSGVINFVSWEKGPTPIGTVGSMTFEAWIPHFSNSPHAYTPGEGFRYPNNDMMPAAFGDGRIKNLPRGITSSSYGDRFGDMLEFGSRMSAKLGQRVNIVYLAVNNTTLLARAVPNVVDAFQGTLGWWDHMADSDWAPSSASGLSARMTKMLTTIAPAALLAEGSSKSLRYMGIVLNVGDGDALLAAGQQEMAAGLAEFLTDIRTTISAFSPYDDEAKVPLVVPLLTTAPWEEDPLDTGGLVNGAIRQVTATDGFGALTDPADSEKITADPFHYNGVGEAKNGKLLADAMGAVVEYALSFGSEVVANTQQATIDICNMALSHIGETTITSLDPAVDPSRNAALCNTFYRRARDPLLQSRQWSFALRRVALVKTLISPSSWLFGYYVPPEAMTPFALLPQNAIADFSSRSASGTTTGTASAGFTTDGIPLFFDDQFSKIAAGVYIPQDYNVETDDQGNRVLFTNLDNAVLRYVSKTVNASRYGNMFITALSYALSALLAGPIIKGRQGLQISREQLQLAGHHHGLAAENDAGHRSSHPKPVTPWLAAR